MSNQAERLFKNELNREIKIEVMDGWGRQNGVMVQITGPDSRSTNLLTRMEAENLREALNEWAAS